MICNYILNVFIKGLLIFVTCNILVYLIEIPDHLADMWLESTARGTMHQYCEQILKIQEVSHHAVKQLTTDIGK